MKYIYDLDDVLCENKARKAVKCEIINILESLKDNTIDIETLFGDARKNILMNISDNYFNDVYQDNISFDSETTAELDKRLKSNVSVYKKASNLKERCNSIINSGEYDLDIIEEVREVLKEIIQNEDELKFSFILIKRFLIDDLIKNSPMESMVFCKLDNGKYGVVEWIKPYLDRINFYTLSISDINIENYDFTGTKGINISSKNIENNTLSNTVLNGATIKCYHNGELYPIDSSIIDITGTDFTGSKGAIVDLENITEIPENCNLTDAMVIVNSKADIKKFNLEKYNKNIYIKQNSIVCNDDIIDYDISHCFNYTGTIDGKQTKYIKEALEVDGANKEKTRVESNKMISYLIASELANMVNFNNLYKYFAIVRRTKKYVDEPPAALKDTTILNSNVYKKPEIDTVSDSLYTLYKKIGSPFNDGFRYTISDNKFKVFTNHGILTIDLLRLGLSAKDLEFTFKNEKILHLPLFTNKIIVKFYNTLYNCVAEIEDKIETGTDDEKSIASVFGPGYASMFYSYHKVEFFEECFIDTLENLIYKNLETNNKGYSYAIKKVRTR